MSHTEHSLRAPVAPVGMERGQLVQAIPASPLWQRGARWGEVLNVKARASTALVSFGKLGRLWVSFDDVVEC